MYLSPPLRLAASPLPSLSLSKPNNHAIHGRTGSRRGSHWGTQERPALAPTFPPCLLGQFLGHIAIQRRAITLKGILIKKPAWRRPASNVSFGSPLRARARVRPRLPSLLSGRRRRSLLLTLKEASKHRLAAVTAGTKPFSPSEHGNRRGNVENVEGGRHCSCIYLSFPNRMNST